MKKTLCLILILALTAAVLPAALAEENTPVPEERTVSYYNGSIDDVSQITLAFFDGIGDIAYISLETMADVLTKGLREEGKESKFALTVGHDGATYFITRENGSSVFLTPENDLIAFEQLNRFAQRPDHSVNLMDLAFIGNGDRDAYLLRHSVSSVRNGKATVLDLSQYDISMREANGTVYLPLQTFSDVIYAPFGGCVCYNGEIAVLASGGCFKDAEGTLTELGEIWYGVERGDRSEELAYFSYCELCLALDLNYGLKEAHNIESFHTFLSDIGLAEALSGTDAKAAAQAVSDLCAAYFGDMHSALVSVTPLIDPDTETGSFETITFGLFSYLTAMSTFTTACMKYYPDLAVPGYEEVGNTAYVTFNKFIMDAEKDYYTAELPETFTAEDADTIELIEYAHRQITREGSPVENVVLDLSRNGGGILDTALAVCAWYRNVACLHFEDAADGAQSSTVYQFDADLDHEYNSLKDCLIGKNLFCLISPLSFSCGNLVPAVFKSSGGVTLIGQTSAGGACVVQTLSTADGTVFNCSGRFHMSTEKNGSFYSVDEGVEPDFYLPSAEQYYDRAKLTDYINGLLWKD